VTDEVASSSERDKFAPGLPSNYDRLRGKIAVGHARIDHHLVEITRLWHTDNSELKAKLGATGNFGGSDILLKSLDSLKERADEGVKTMLAELARAVRDRGRTWHRLHQYAEKRVQEHLSVCAEQAVLVMWRGGKEGEQLAKQRVDWIISRQQAEISMHNAGWTSPPPDSLEARYPILSKVALAIFAFALGVLSGPITSTVFPKDKQSERVAPSVEQKPLPPTQKLQPPG